MFSLMESLTNPYRMDSNSSYVLSNSLLMILSACISPYIAIKVTAHLLCIEK